MNKKEGSLLWALIEVGAEGAREKKIKRYESRTKKKVSELIQKAESGNKRAFFKLIEIDKSFLFEPWAKILILAADQSSDLGENSDTSKGLTLREKRDFFEGLATSLQKFPRESPYKDKISDLKKIISYAESSGSIKTIQTPKGRRKFWEILNSEWMPESWSDFNTFDKILKRHILKE